MQRREFLAFLTLGTAFGAISNLSANSNLNGEKDGSPARSKKEKTMKILILGATGSLGKYVIDALLARGGVELVLFGEVRLGLRSLRASA